MVDEFNPSGAVKLYVHVVSLLVALKVEEEIPLNEIFGAIAMVSLKMALNSIASSPLKKLESLSHSSDTLGGVSS